MGKHFTDPVPCPGQSLPAKKMVHASNRQKRVVIVKSTGTGGRGLEKAHLCPCPAENLPNHTQLSGPKMPHLGNDAELGACGSF